MRARIFIVRRLQFALLATAVVFAGLEIVIRLTGWGLPRSDAFFVDIYDPVLRLGPAARNPFVEMEEFLNGRGFRGPGFEAVKKPGTTRIVCLGDSQTFGAGTYEEAYPAQLAHVLHEQYEQRPVEVINAGVHGTNIYQQRLLFERMFAGVELDLLVLMTGPNARHSISDYRRRLQSGAGRAVSRIHRLLAALKTYRVLRRAIKGDVHAGIPDDDPRASDLDLDQYNEDLRAFVNMARDRGFALMLVASTDEVLVNCLDRAGLDPTAPEFSAQAMVCHFDRPQAEFAAITGIPYTVFWDRFLTEQRRGTELWHDPDHANAFGNRLIAEAVAKNVSVILGARDAKRATTSAR
ncbi:MAG: SGNH/GDSL hydrolase family protein [Candidatus Lernaella stagnicola]|nr:SGNH/GDSL hydrolase family protein [Candidatus Lernaella stagnicola]